LNGSSYLKCASGNHSAQFWTNILKSHGYSNPYDATQEGVLAGNGKVGTVQIHGGGSKCTALFTVITYGTTKGDPNKFMRSIVKRQC